MLVSVVFPCGLGRCGAGRLEWPGMTAPLREILLKLCRREDLTRDEAREAFAHVMSGDATEAQIGGLLVGLAAKGATVDELVGAALVMREKAVAIEGDPTAGVILDTRGTGGGGPRGAQHLTGGGGTRPGGGGG